MENINISINIEQGKTISEDIPEKYTKTRTIILEDLKRILLYLETIENNEAKELLIKNIIDTYVGYEKCFDPNIEKYTLNLVLEDDYLLFDFNNRDQKHTVIIKRNMHEFYFLTDSLSTCYKIEDGRVYEYETREVKYAETVKESVININSTLDDKVCANCDWSISPLLEDEIINEQSSFDIDELPSAGDCCLGKSNINLTCDSHYCESGIMSLRKINNQ